MAVRTPTGSPSGRALGLGAAAALLLLVGCCTVGLSMELQGTVSLEGRLFPQASAYQGQEDYDASLVLEPELYWEGEGGLSCSLKPFLRLDTSDPERSHSDLREANLLYGADSWQLLFGLDKVFWGVTEFVHLVDIVNQTDLVESPDQEEKLGQPMLALSLEQEWGTLEAYLLPLFRERTFPGSRGRLRGPLVIDSGAAEYESGAGRTHPDLALRYSHTLGNLDLGLYQFFGTSREPLFLPSAGQEEELIPFYSQISQTGLDLQLVEGQWLWKLEALQRSGQGPGRGAVACGFEYTWVRPWQLDLDLGFIAEYVRDQRRLADDSPYDNDLMLGMRLGLNDAQGSELLLGMVQDLAQPSCFMVLEAGQRLGESLHLSLSGYLFVRTAEQDPLRFYQQDSYLLFKGSYYF
ncbi:hypothetical protein [Desulfogranum mediterraneum]|uniref:hypothetical protein n=1 Tax=Desulfogranum mediterraneum TaxID=160661 RepID=UPI00054D76CD|nr:hypothetical protein [Desulfogranum mediterraneum]